jgi:hypothetical protein
MPNKYAFPINPDVPWGEAIEHISKKRKMGSATLTQLTLLETFKDEIIAFWTSQGRDGQKLYDVYHEKFSIDEDTQKTIKEAKLLAMRKKAYLKLGYSEEDAEFWAKLPKEEVERMMDIHKMAQTKPEETEVFPSPTERKIAEIEHDRARDISRVQTSDLDEVEKQRRIVNINKRDDEKLARFKSVT